MSPETPPDGSTNQPRSMSYRGHDVIYHDPGEPAMPRVSIDGADLMIRREETGGYSAPMLNMFATYSTMEELARSLIDISPVFLARRQA
jgi:hypothetical protein